MIEIKEVKGRKLIKAFINFPLDLYKGNPYFVPPLYMDEVAAMKDKNAHSKEIDCKFFLAFKDGKVVGRIEGIHQKVSNAKYNQKRVRISRFDFIDDIEVSKALLNAIKDWSLSLGMNELVGPLGKNDMEREGLLVEGFNEESTFEEQYNASYYEKHYLSYGFESECEWVESRLTKPETFDERVINISEKMMKRLNLHVVENKNTKQLLKKYAAKFFDIYDETYGDLYMSVPLTEAEKKELIKGFQLIITPDYCKFIADENDELVAIGLVFPTIGRHLMKSGGRLTIKAIVNVLKEVKHTKGLDLGLIAVKKEYANTGIHWSIVKLVVDKLMSGEIEYADTNLNMVDNLSIRNMWKYFNERQNKKRRAYSVKIAD